MIKIIIRDSYEKVALISQKKIYFNNPTVQGAPEKLFFPKLIFHSTGKRVFITHLGNVVKNWLIGGITQSGKKEKDLKEVKK